MKRHSALLLIVACGSVLSGCASMGNAISNGAASMMDVGRVESMPYDDAAFASYAGATGTAVITGQAFEKTNGGDVKYAAGDIIRLLPVTPYTTEYIRQMAAHKNMAGEGMFASGRYTGDAANLSAMHGHELTTTADGSGRFEFRNVPPGNYWVYVRITWLAGGDETGGLASASVTVENGKTYNLVVTG